MAAILEPFEEATDYVQKQNSVSSGYVIPCIRGLQYHLNEMTSKYNSAFIQTLKQSLDKRMAQYENNRSFRMAACLDVRFKLGWTRDTTESRVQAELTLVARTSSGEPVVEQAVRKGPTDAVLRSKLFKFMATAHLTQATQASACPIVAEVKQYISEPCIAENADAIQYWQGQMVKLPTLAKLAKLYLSLQASSSPVERIFIQYSRCETIFSPPQYLHPGWKYRSDIFTPSTIFSPFTISNGKSYCSLISSNHTMFLYNKEPFYIFSMAFYRFLFINISTRNTKFQQQRGYHA